jgi:hypothetical protein
MIRGTDMNTFADLAPTEIDAAGVVGGDAFLDLSKVVGPILGIVTSLFVHVD